MRAREQSLYAYNFWVVKWGRNLRERNSREDKKVIEGRENHMLKVCGLF